MKDPYPQDDETPGPILSLLKIRHFDEIYALCSGASSIERAKSGAMRSADKGTLFLDEVGDFPLIIQAKLLKAIEEKTFYPVGSDKPVSVDVRIIAATNKNLRQRIHDGLFRRDLYERLNVIAITLPPLRDRPDDIEALIGKTLRAWNREYGEHKRLSESAKDLIYRYS